MEGFLAGIFTAFLLCILFFTSDCQDNYRHFFEHNKDHIEERAQKAYQDYGNSTNWYKGDKHLEPWIKLSEDEKESWRLGMNFCGHGDPQTNK